MDTALKLLQESLHVIKDLQRAMLSMSAELHAKRWRLVEDELPGLDEPVLCYNGKEVFVASRIDLSGQYWSANQCGFSGLYVPAPTHWCSRPNPPENAANPSEASAPA